MVGEGQHLGCGKLMYVRAGQEVQQGGANATAAWHNHLNRHHETLVWQVGTAGRDLALRQGGRVSCPVA